ncbi:hypothetical protein QA600_03865 [Natronococcus sp. A-GB1]|uniref:hypothetical protein n=1 Tax=Natronococcus sp. A-GB1 TaxID=3037648 RepID=UPI00241C516B|nr:hypothetical protein [Natronococcus sp. A-GB1]MDG5758472.1 hypothetical protein [Natronococcus sp. A-GB1]
MSTTTPPQSQPDPLVGTGTRIDAALHWLYLHGDRRIVSGLMLPATFVVSLLLIRSSLITPAEADEVVAISSR